MAVHSGLISVEELARLLRITIPSQDSYARMIIEQASNRVREVASQPGWVRVDEGSTPGVGQTLAPATAHDVTLWISQRAYTNPKNLERRTSGPVSETFRDSGVYGIEPTDDERSRLVKLSPSGGSGLWVQPLDYGEDDDPVIVPSVTSYGVTDLGGTYLGMGSQFPWNLP